jgi:HAD superfamily hydrolase (TIGR01509 family)
MSSAPAALIFDLDGCLVDSELFSIGTIVEVVHEMGFSHVTFEDIRARFLGVSMKVICGELTRDTGQAVCAEFVYRVETRLFATYKKRLRQIDGVEAMLSTLKKNNIAMAVATGGSIRRMNETLSISGLAPWFDNAAFSADQVDYDKPAPDLFLFTAAKLGVPADKCVVLEDSPHGVQGAVAAGMRVVGFVGGSHLDGMHKAHIELLKSKGADTVAGTLMDALVAFLPDEMRV